MRTHGWAGAAPASDEEAIARILAAAGKAIDENGADISIADVARTRTLAGFGAGAIRDARTGLGGELRGPACCARSGAIRTTWTIRTTSRIFSAGFSIIGYQS